ncbi:MAG: pyridoxal phosphate-dependent aminotransferase [Chitinophagales bacterium]
MQVLEKTTVLSNRIVNLAESATLKMAALARQLKQEGKDVISLSIGEPDFGTPEHIKEAAIQAIKDGYSHYTPVPGYLDLREAIVQKFKRDNNLDFTTNQIVVSTGAKQSLANVILSTVNPGEEVIMPIPYWVSYAAQVELAEGVLVEVPTSIENKFKITPESLENAITEKTKLFVFSSPCNPTGSLYTKEELHALAEVFAKYENIYIVSDEIYEHITFEGKHESIAQFEIIKDRVIVVNGLSKGFAMTGWRLGYIAAPLEIAKACGKMQGQFTSGTCGITQRAAIAALTGTLEPTYAMREEFKKRRELVLGLLNDIPGVKTYVPNGAFYVFPDVSYYLGKSTDTETINTVDDFCMYLLNDCQVSVVTGAAFGNDQCFRLSYAASTEQLTEALRRIKASLAKLH